MSTKTQRKHKLITYVRNTIFVPPVIFSNFKNIYEIIIYCHIHPNSLGIGTVFRCIKKNKKKTKEDAALLTPDLHV